MAAARVAPRTRGWARVHAVGCGAHGGRPAHAGMGPSPRGHTRTPRGVAPRTRGWAAYGDAGQRGKAGRPAHAGMGPHDVFQHHHGGRSPRARGDGPRDPSGVVGRAWSPRARWGGPFPTFSGASAVTVAPRTQGWAPQFDRSRLCWRGRPENAGKGPRRGPSRRPRGRCRAVKSRTATHPGELGQQRSQQEPVVRPASQATRDSSDTGAPCDCPPVARVHLVRMCGQPVRAGRTRDRACRCV